MERKINIEKSLLFFRTRKNSQLISFGLKPGCLYLIVNISNANNSKQSNKIVTFL